MSTSVTWNGTARSIPAAGELNWATLSLFLIDLANNAATTNLAKQSIRVALTTPVTVAAASDYAIVTDLTAPGAVAVNLPAGVDKQIYVIADGKGDAGTNNVTINPAGTDKIGGASSLVLSHNRETVVIQYHAGTTDWKILARTLAPGTITPADITGVIGPDKGGTGISNNNAATTTRVGNFAKTETLTGVTSVTFPLSGTLATLAGSESFTNKTIGSGNILSGATASNFKNGAFTVTLFGANDTVIGTATTDALTNKNLGSATNTLTGATCASLLNIGTITFFAGPDTVVGRSTTDTLLNKTISGASNTLTVLAGSQLSGQAPIANGGTGAATKAAGFDALSPMTTSGDIIYGGASGTGTRLGKGSDGQALTLVAGLPAWGNVATDPTTTRGDLIRRGAAALERFSAVTNNRVVRGNGTDVVLGQIDDPGFFTTSAAATEAAIGIVTAGVQNFAGVKTFYDGLKLDDAGTQSTLNDYQATSTTVTFQGNAGGSASSAITIRMRRIGDMVLVDISACGDATSASNSTYLVSNTALAAQFRPVSQSYSAPCIVKSNNVEQNSPGRLEILTSGLIRFYFSLDTGTAAFANAATNGFTHQTAMFVGA